jgi:endonuclease-3
LANIKAPRILAILDEIREREDGSLDLTWMRTATSARVREYLLSLPGVGPKTAACVLAFSLERPALPVDTHVGRVSRRLGLTRQVDPDKVERELGALLPPERWGRAHQLLIWHGRRTCFARRPKCSTCVVAADCPKVGVTVRA